VNDKVVDEIRPVSGSMEDKLYAPIRRLAEYEAAAAAEIRSKSMDEHNAAFRWLIASLFALNGGAILALLGSDHLTGAAILRSAPSFFLGVILTFAMVMLAQLSDRKMIQHIHSWGLYWSTVTASLLRDENQENQIKSAIEMAELTGRKARVCGLLSMACFVVGCILATTGLIK
jgi:hypothetical protein